MKGSGMQRNTYWIWGTHDGYYEEYHLLQYNAVSTSRSPPTFQRTVLPPSSRSKTVLSKNPGRSKQMGAVLSLKCQWTSTGLYSITSQMTGFFRKILVNCICLQCAVPGREFVQCIFISYCFLRPSVGIKLVSPHFSTGFTAAAVTILIQYTTAGSTVKHSFSISYQIARTVADTPRPC
jgi:hypothetical protein